RFPAVSRSALRPYLAGSPSRKPGPEVQARLQSSLAGIYRLERELGGGGMSRVFLAQELRLGRRVVIKVLPPETSAGVHADRVEREIQVAASLQHPHVVPLLTAGATDDGGPRVDRKSVV